MCLFTLCDVRLFFWLISQTTPVAADTKLHLTDCTSGPDACMTARHSFYPRAKRVYYYLDNRGVVPKASPENGTSSFHRLSRNILNIRPFVSSPLSLVLRLWLDSGQGFGLGLRLRFRNV